jgi:uncharacterized protein DUF3455
MRPKLFARELVLGTLSCACAIGMVIRPARADQIVPPMGDSIAVPAGNKPFLVVHAIGTQTYTCTSVGLWSAASVPDARLFASNGKQIGIHFVGPRWQLKDGSLVKGRKVAFMTSQDPMAIQWLLLQADSTGAGPEGDRLLPTTYIQRVNTVGGKPATPACTVGTTISVPYQADYYFYRAASGE